MISPFTAAVLFSLTEIPRVDLTYLGILKAVGVKSFYDCEMFSQKKRFQYQNSLTALEKVCRCAEEQDEHYTTTTISVHVFGKDSRWASPVLEAKRLRRAKSAELSFMRKVHMVNHTACFLVISGGNFRPR